MSARNHFVIGSTASAIAAALSLTCLAGELAVVEVTPQSRSLDASIYSSISVRFSAPVNRQTITSRSFWAFGHWSGPVEGAVIFSESDRVVTLVPDQPLSAGEQVMVNLSHDIRSTGGDPLRAAGYAFQFRTRVRPSQKNFAIQQNVSTRHPNGPSTRTYGGVGTDVDDDGWLDLTLTNEDTNDVRVFLNGAGGDGMLEDFLRPPASVGQTPSPCEPADFDHDGNVDLCVANTRGSSVSILFGAGDGTWKSHTEITVGNLPRGIAAFDVDGDGDADIINTNANSGNLSLLRNNGDGTFASPVFFDAGGTNEWALGAADMNEDGILDLVVGSRFGQEILINLGNGDGTFTFASRRASGGQTWMLNCGDLNGDGHDDVACANSASNNGSILLGNGDGTLQPAQTRSTDSFPLATDIGDIDGDGDLDWVTSSFSGDWFIFTNDGSGSFTFFREIDAPSAASCALLLDLDNDRDLDLALIDEIADRLITYKNDGTNDLAATLTNLAILDGTLISGGLPQLVNSDNQYLETEARVTGEVHQPHLLRIDVGADSDSVGVAEAEIVFESRITDVSASVELFLRDWQTNQFRPVGSFTVGLAESVERVGVADAGAFVRASDGRIDLRIRKIVLLPFTLNGFHSLIDQIELRVW